MIIGMHRNAATVKRCLSLFLLSLFSFLPLLLAVPCVVFSLAKTQKTLCIKLQQVWVRCRCCANAAVGPTIRFFWVDFLWTRIAWEPIILLKYILQTCLYHSQFLEQTRTNSLWVWQPSFWPTPNWRSLLITSTVFFLHLETVLLLITPLCSPLTLKRLVVLRSFSLPHLLAELVRSPRENLIFWLIFFFLN